MTRTPVALFVYNRLDTLQAVYEAIAEARPPLLLVVADAPSATSPDDARRCDAVLDFVSRPAWPCQVRINRSDVHLGLGRRFASGLAWVFTEVERAIILEDDCLPHASFFPFCDLLLDRYADEPQIMMVSGDNYQFGIRRGAAHYYFSHGVGTYGWATWRRAFRHYDFTMRDWPSERSASWLTSIWPVPEIAAYWRERFEETFRGEVDTWDFQWAFAMWRNKGLQISPDRNLVSYLGCRSDAVHTRDSAAAYCAVPAVPMPRDLKHPPRSRDLGADVYEFYRIFKGLGHRESRDHEIAALGRIATALSQT